MRTATAAQLALLALEDRSSHVKVEVYISSSWVDLTDLFGRDWVVGVSFSDNVDSQVVKAAVTVGREDEKFSLAPLMDSSALNTSMGGTLDLGVPLRIYTAVASHGVVQVSGWVWKFEGYIKSVDWGKTPLKINALGDPDKLGATFIETVQIYGSPSGTAIETVIQDILDDHAPGTTLYSENGTAGTPWNSSDSPGWLLKEYKQSKDHVLPAIRKLAQQIGWECKWKWHPNTSAFQLQLYSVERKAASRGTLTFTGQPSNAQTFVYNSTTFTAKTTGAGTDEFNIGSTVAETCDNVVAMFKAGTEKDNGNAWREGDTVVFEWREGGTAGDAVVFTEALSNCTADGSGTLGGTRSGSEGKTSVDHTFSADEYEDINRLSLDIGGIRNKVKVTYADSASGERTSVIVRDSASISKYGTLYMETTERSSGQIDTGAEATDFAQAILADLSEAEATMAVVLPHFWPAEVGDLYTFEANNIHFDTDQTFAVVDVRDAFIGGTAATQLRVRGKPSGGFKRWLAYQGMPGVAPPVDDYTDGQPNNVTITPGAGQIVVEYDDPRTMSPPVDDWDYTECHVSTSSGFTPSASTLKGKGKVTRFEVGALEPLLTYYVKLIIVDKQGNIASTSTQVTTATQAVGTYLANNQDIRENMIPNGTFGHTTFNINDVPPDGWSTNGYSAGWGVVPYAYVFYDTTYFQSGGRSLKFYHAAGGGAITIGIAGQGYGTGAVFDPGNPNAIPIEQDTLYEMLVVVRSTSTALSFDCGLAYLTTGWPGSWTKSALFSNQTVTVANTWQVFRAYFYAGSSWAIVTPYFDINTTFYGTMYLDRMVITRTQASFHAYRNASLSLSSSSVLVFDTEVYDKGSCYDTATGRYTVKEEGSYRFDATVCFSAVTSGSSTGVRFYVNGVATSWGSFARMASGGGAARQQVTKTFYLNVGDYVDVRPYHNMGGTTVMCVGSQNCSFTGERLK